MPSELSLTLSLPRQSMRNSAWVIGLITGTTDLLSIALATLALWAGLAYLGGASPAVLDAAAAWWPLLGALPVAYGLMGLYPGIPIYPGAAVGYAEELRRLTLATSVVWWGLLVAGLVAGVLVQSALLWAVLTWLAMLVLVPLGRNLVRPTLYGTKWWGYPVIVFGAGKTGQVVISSLQRSPELGLRPVAVLDDDRKKQGQVCGVPVLGGLDCAGDLAGNGQVPYAIMAMPGLPPDRTAQFIENFGRLFRCWLIIGAPSLNFATMWVSAKNLNGVEGLELRSELSEAHAWQFKRICEVLLVLLGGLVAFPLMGLIALAIKLDSKGPVFFRQQRPGQHGRPFTILKFRTMYQNADELFEQLTPEQQQEFTEYGKIRNDPRATRVGRFLRCTSLDELPQLVNVLKGQMSLVGPRPYLDEQVEQMNHHRYLIMQVPPGISGLWQVSGRSETTLEERLALDAFYVRNWSIWLDLGILTRTAFVVLFGRGAY